MQKFENFSIQRKPEDEIISSIFPHEGREGFHKKVEEALISSRRGGFRKGTPMFIRAVVGSMKLKPEEFSFIKKEIAKETEKIEKEVLVLPTAKVKLMFNPDQRKNIKDGAIKWEKEELDRSGGVDPNE